jgi:hypothetical protein
LRSPIVPILLSLFFVTSAVSANVPLQRIGDEIRSSATGCVVTPIDCAPVNGELAPGDCTLSDGTRYDVYQFFANAGDFVQFTLVPQTTTLTNPLLYLVPPKGDATDTPLIGGMGNPQIRFTISSTGTWTLVVGTLDLFAAGSYQVLMGCFGAADPTVPQNCVGQRVDCGQFEDWSVNATSCRFNNSSRGYIYSTRHLNEGDVINMSFQSNDFDPVISIYEGGGQPLKSDFAKRFELHQTTFIAPKSDDYQIAISPTVDNVGGDVYLKVDCQLACSPPVIATQPAGGAVAAGGSFTFNVAMTGNGPFTYRWYQGSRGDVSHPIGTNAPSLQLSNIVETTTVWVNVTGACGIANSNDATVTVNQCVPPAITAQPASGPIPSGGSWTFSVAATGTSPLQYQWYQGDWPDVSHPLGTQPSYQFIQITQPVTVWVRVSNSCGSTDSTSATASIVATERRRAAKH